MKNVNSLMRAADRISLHVKGGGFTLEMAEIKERRQDDVEEARGIPVPKSQHVRAL